MHDVSRQAPARRDDDGGRERQVKWWNDGKTPDYRFTLANERTFLAWIRTALAFMAGAVGIDQFTPDLGVPWMRHAVTTALLVAAFCLGLCAYRRWAATERAMRQEKDIPYTGLLPLIALFVSLVGMALLLLILVR